MIQALKVAISVAAFLAFAAESPASSCKPTWTYLSKGKSLAVDSGTYTVEFSAILVGCEQSLGMLKQEELVKVQDALKRFLGQRSLDLIGSVDKKELRRDAVAAINQALRRQAVADVFFCHFAVGEAM